MPTARVTRRAVEALSLGVSTLTLALPLLIVPGVAADLEDSPPTDFTRPTVPEKNSTTAPTGTGGVEPLSTTAAPVDEVAEFVSVVLADTEDTWGRIFGRMGETYREPILVLYTGQIASGCGFVRAMTGPLYCSNDEKMYFDLGFFDTADNSTGARDMMIAYAVARNVGYHVQNFRGVVATANDARGGATKVKPRPLPLMLELQAACFAGIWAHDANSRSLLEVGDLDGLLAAAAQIGGDGLSDERAGWFRRGFENGSLDDCDTFPSGIR